MKQKLPPLNSVRSFEAAARHLNFTAAADELGMSQAAVSYQIKILEDFVQSELFTRQARGVFLTPVGERLANPVKNALRELREAFAILADEHRDTLVISVTPTIAANFLAHRLGLFQIQYPTMAVRVEVNQKVVDLSAGEADVAIRSGDGNWPDMECDLLFSPKVTPMLAPMLAETIGGVRTPADLLKLPLLEAHEPWWTEWFERAGVPSPDLKKQSSIQFGAQVLEGNAAIEGVGVGRLSPAMYGNAISQKQLIQPFDLILEDRYKYWLVYPTLRRNTKKVKLFRRWILEEALALE